MRCWNDCSAIFEDSRALLFGIIYPAICIICALVIAQRIRRGQQRKYMQLERQMDTPSEKGGGEESSGATNADISYPTHIIYDRASLPSAYEILQPLSHSSPLPPSGYLATVLRQERSQKIEQAKQQENRSIQPSSSSGYGSGDSAPVNLRTHHSQRDPSSGIQVPPTQSDDSSQAASFSSTRGEGDSHGLASSPDSGEIQPVQKRSQQVQFLRDVDEDGVRTWRRWVVEYS
ncbi:hypothetical protein BDV12DRAFT_72781 [Aspergillus spectabilis]